jgi:hypothetical protein
MLTNTAIALAIPPGAVAESAPSRRPAQRVSHETSPRPKVRSATAERARNRIFMITNVVFALLCIAPGALMIFVAVFALPPAGRERPPLQVARDWTSFPPADRASCLSATGSGGAYTDLLKCLEIKRDARHHPKGPGMPRTVGSGKPE